MVGRKDPRVLLGFPAKFRIWSHVVGNAASNQSPSQIDVVIVEVERFEGQSQPERVAHVFGVGNPAVQQGPLWHRVSPFRLIESFSRTDMGSPAPLQPEEFQTRVDVEFRRQLDLNFWLI
jgi:hypothetical protein